VCHAITRRQALAGLIAGIAGGAAGCAPWIEPTREERMRDDFASGDVFQVRGWFVSRTEAEELGLSGDRPVFPGAP